MTMIAPLSEDDYAGNQRKQEMKMEILEYLKDKANVSC